MLLLALVALVAAGSVAAARQARLADLVLTGRDRPDPAKVGKGLTYTLRLHNRGPNAAQGVRLSGQVGRIGDYARPSLVLLKVRGKGCRKLPNEGGEEPAAPAFACAVRTMPARTTQIVTVLIRPTRAGTFRLAAVVTSATRFHSATLQRRRLHVQTTVNRR